MLREYHIDPDKVTHIITAGGSAFCKAFKIYGKRVDTLVEAPTDIIDDNNNDDMDSIQIIEVNDGEPFYGDIINFDCDQDFLGEYFTY